MPHGKRNALPSSGHSSSTLLRRRLQSVDVELVRKTVRTRSRWRRCSLRRSGTTGSSRRSDIPAVLIAGFVQWWGRDVSKNSSKEFGFKFPLKPRVKPPKKEAAPAKPKKKRKTAPKKGEEEAQGNP